MKVEKPGDVRPCDGMDAILYSLWRFFTVGKEKCLCALNGLVAYCLVQ